MAENGCVTNKAGELGMVKCWPQKFISAGKSRTAEFQVDPFYVIVQLAKNPAML